MSKYTVATGPGYQGVHKVTGTAATLFIGNIGAVEWTPGTEVYSIAHEDGAALVEGTFPDDEFLDSHCVREDGGGPEITVRGSTTGVIGVSSGSDIRMYDLQEHADRPGILLVDADNDPVVENGGDVDGE